MSDPQIWTLIGVFTATMLGGMTLMTTLLGRTISAGFGRTDARFEAIDAKFEATFQAVDARFDALRAEMNARFDATDAKLGHLDRDVTLLMRRAWGEPTTE